MKAFKLLGTLFIFIILVTVVLSLLMPVYQKVTRSVSIHAPAEKIFEKIKTLEAFNKFSVWSQADSTVTYNSSGTDGQIGAQMHWKGHPMISGEGTITIAELIPAKKVSHKIEFIKPKKGKADSILELLQTSRDSTTVTWTFKMATPRPWNIFNFFYNLDKERGAEFEEGLSILKAMIEK
jgi:hypothetical protein